jgi:acyl-CoA synthetase (NDP forming)
MQSQEEVSAMEICECGQKSVADAIKIFQNSSLPYKKAKKLVTECNKTCCRTALMRVYDMSLYGRFDYEEIAFLIEQRKERLKYLGGDDVAE